MNSVPLNAGVNGAPTLVVLGAPRCGTTSLARYLQDGGLNVGVKDSFFLMDQDSGLRGPTHLESHGTRGYLDLFDDDTSPTVEVSAGYLYQETALEFFAEWRRAPRFVVVTRDPVERLQSVYRYFMGNLGVIPRECSFDQYVVDLEIGEMPAADRTVCDALDQGNYARWLGRWTDRFGEGAVSVVSFDDLSTKPAVVVRKLIAEAGGEPSTSLAGYNFEPRNGSYVPRSRHISRLTSLARRIAPAGAARAWAGESLRRWQSSSTQVPGEALTPQNDTLARLARYYEPANKKLSDRFGVDTRGWTQP